MKYQGHDFDPAPLPAPSYGAPGSLAFVFPSNARGHKCATCSLLIGVEGPLSPSSEGGADRIHVGWGSFENTDQWWNQPLWKCKP